MISMTKECTICSNTLDLPCSDYPNSEYKTIFSRACLLRQRDSLAAQIRHLHSQLSRSSTATPSSQTSLEPQPTTVLSVSTLLSWADLVLSNVSLLEQQPIVLRQWLKHIQHTDFNLSVAVAWDIQKAILDAITAAAARYSPSAPTSGPISQSAKDSPNDTTAKWDGALVDETGATKLRTKGHYVAGDADETGAVDYPEENRGKTIYELTDLQLQNEYNYWVQKVIGAPSWGAALGQANEFKIHCEQELKRRNLAPKIQWQKSDEEVYTFDNYTIVPGKNDSAYSCFFKHKLIAVHRNPTSAKADCETHYLATRSKT